MSVRSQTRVISAPKPSSTPIRSELLQRKCACDGTPSLDGECTACRAKRLGLQRRSTTQAEPSTVPPIVHDVLHSSGQPLDPAMRAFMEPRFGHDFGQVRVHTDAWAAESARAVNALAYTVGRDIVFEAQRYAPRTRAGRELLAHELAHVVQQSGLDNFNTSAVAALSSRHSTETEARKAAQEISTRSDASASPLQVGRSIVLPVLQRYEAGEHAQYGETGGTLKQFVAERAFNYKVKPGETLRKIASKFGITVEELKEANNVKLRSWPEMSGSGKRVEGFNAGEEIVIPPIVNEVTKEALRTKELTLMVNGVKLEYGEGIAMGDFFQDPGQMMSAPKAKLEELSKLIQKEKSGTPASTAEWEKATDGRYLKLAEKNEAHFAPSNPKLVATSGKATINHQIEWEKHHTAALAASQAGDKDKALAVNAFGDHFLTDAFAGGHLVNKRDVMEVFKGNLTVDPKGEFTAGSKAFFDAVAKKAFVGSVKKEFSQHETVEYKGVVFRPNIDSESRFSSLLQGIQQKEPDLLANAVAKAVHDALNKQPTGVPVENEKGDKWDLSGDGTLNAKSKEVGRKAVAQSQFNVLDVFKLVTALDLPALFKKVWDFVPRPTSPGETLVKKEVASGTDPKSTKLIDAVVTLITTNYKIILDELVKRGVLKKA